MRKRCQICKKKAFFVYVRTYTHNFFGEIVGKDKMCNTCAGKMKRIIKKQNENTVV